jgi:hypothetical protein
MMIRENPNYTILPLDSRNQESAQIPGLAESKFLESNGKMVQLGFSLINQVIEVKTSPTHVSLL